MLVEEDSRLAAASVVGIGSPPLPSPLLVLLSTLIPKCRKIAAQLLASYG
jgi:hypothetical protein